MTQPPSPPPAFTILRKLGSGTFGVANLCLLTETNQQVVIKEQLINAAKDARSATQMLFEAQMMESLAHPHIVRFFDSWWSGEKFFIAMEFCEFGDLRQAIRQRRVTHTEGFSEVHIVRWVGQIASALQYCHVQHILHRDLKAENIFVCRSTKSATNTTADLDVKLADFGFARTLHDTVSFANTRLGTPASLAPEITECSPYNNRADMWSLGILLYELMTLRRPFVGVTVPEVLDSILQDEPEDAELLTKGKYSPDLYALVKALLSKDPKKRPSASDVLSMSFMKTADASKMAAFNRERELEAWFKISYPAALENSTIHVHVGEFAVNIREAPDTQSKLLSKVCRGETIEEVARKQPHAGGPVWFQLPTGYCIRNDPATGRKLFREVPEWRVRRPNSQWDESTPTESTASSTDGDKKANEALGRDFASPQERLQHLLRFLGEQELPESLVSTLIDDYDKLRSSACDDTCWTFFCVKTLRSFKAVHCLRVLRVAIRLIDKVS